MQFEQLKYIVSVAHHKNISKAAKELSISQSALSQSILKLESELKIEIFQRNRNGVTITKTGEFVINTATEILEKADKIFSFSNSKSVQKKALNIGIISGLHLPFIPNLFSKLKREFPYLDVELFEFSSLKIIKALMDTNIDLGILAIYEETEQYQKKINFIEIQKINMFVFLSKKSPLSSKRALTPTDLKHETFITYNGEYMNWFFSKYRQLYGEFEELLTTQNNQTISETVKNNLAIAIEVEPEIYNNRYVNSGDIVVKPLILNGDFNEGHLGIGYLNNKILPPDMMSFIQILENELININYY
ncbi:LysR family transcriptional regulator [Virgibacillus ainsalahensis]